MNMKDSFFCIENRNQSDEKHEKLIHVRERWRCVCRADGMENMKRETDDGDVMGTMKVA